MKYAAISFFLLVVWCSRASGTGGSVAGRVTGMGDTAGVAGVNIMVQGTVRGTTTNALGEYRIADLPAGTKTLVFSIIGYQREIRSGIVIEDGKEFRLNVSLAQSPVQADQIVITASKRAQSLVDVPVSVSILEGAEIQQRNTLSLEDALRYVPGVNLTGTQVNIRGSSGYSLGAGSRVLMLLDGVPFLAGDTGELNFESIPMGQVDRIEVVKGASSALYGSNALGGVINIITKPIPEIAETIVRTYGGFYGQPEYDQWRWSDHARFFNGQSFSHARRAGALGMSIFASRQIDDGYRQNDYRRRYNMFLKMTEELSSAHSLEFTFGLVYQHTGQFLYWRNVDSALITPLRHETDNVKSTRYFLNGLYNAAISDRTLFTIKTLWSHNDWGFQQSEDPGRTESVSDGFRLEALSTILPDDTHTMTFGVDGNIDVIGGDMFGVRTIGGLALYAQDEAKLRDDLTLTVGARFDLQSIGLSSEGAQFNPKLGIVYHPAAGTAVRASYGQGFRVPSLPEAFVEAGSTGLLAVPNRDLKPERSRSYEIGISQALGAGAAFDVAAFRSDIDNLIEPGLFTEGTGLQVQWRNVTRARVQGIESSGRLSLFDGGLVWNTGYTYVDPEDLSARDILKYRPRHILSTNARARAGWWTVGVDFRYVSRVERIDSELVDAGVIPNGDERVPIYVWDFRCGAEFNVGGTALSATLNVKNAFQHNYVELIGNVMPPRTYIVNVQAAF